MGWSFLWALLLGLALFTLHGRKQGHSLQTMWGMAWSEGRKVLIVLRIFVFIGAITALWRSGGTIVFFIYYGVQAISPKLFVLEMCIRDRRRKGQCSWERPRFVMLLLL